MICTQRSIDKGVSVDKPKRHAIISGDMKKSILSMLKKKYKDFKWEDKNSSKDAAVFKLKGADRNLYVKITNARCIQNQFQMLHRMQDMLPVPQVVEYKICGDFGFVVMSEIKGTRFKEYLSEITPSAAVEIYAKAYNIMKKSGITHGDFCPLNIIIGENGDIAGFVDFDKSKGEKTTKDLEEAIFIITKHFGNEYVKYFLKMTGESLIGA